MAGAFAGGLLLGRKHMLTGAVVALLCTGAAALGWAALRLHTDHPWLSVAFGLLLAPIPVSLLGGLRSAAGRAAVLLSSVAFLVVIWKEPFPSISSIADFDSSAVVFGTDWLLSAAWMTLLVLPGVVLLLLTTHGESSRVVGNPFFRACAVILLIVVSAPPWAIALDSRYGWLITLSVVGLVWASGVWLLPLRRSDVAVRLAAMSPSAQARLLDGDLRRRLLRASAREFYHDARKRIAAGDLTVTEFDEQRRQLEMHPGRSTTTDSISAGDAAWNGGGGRTPRQNGALALRAGLMFGLPLIVIDLMLFLGYLAGSNWPWGASMLMTADFGRWVLRDAVVCFVFGYFYPLLRGYGPVDKALRLALVMLPGELIVVAWTVNSDQRLVAASSGIRLGFILLLVLLLGLFWEHRLLNGAGLVWSRRRDFRNLRTMVTPVVTVLLAAATVAATTLANEAVTGVLKPRTHETTTISSTGPPGTYSR